MPLFSAGQVRIESGNLYSSVMQPLQGVTNVKVGYNLPRANIGILNGGKPLENRPVINYTPVDASFDCYLFDTRLPQCLGILNSTGLCAGITDTKAATATLGIRSMQIAFAPTDSARYNGLLDLKSGVLASYSLQGSISEPVRASVSLQFLDYSGSVNNTARDSSNQTATLIKPENITPAGLQLTGYGLTGITIQSFSFNVGFGRNGIMQLGQRFPVERPLTEVNASFQVQGYFDGINNSVTGLNQFACGAPSSDTVSLTMQPSCGNGSASVLSMIRPYLDSFSIDGQVGGYTTFSLSLSMPIGPNPLETTYGSVVTLT